MVIIAEMPWPPIGIDIFEIDAVVSVMDSIRFVVIAFGATSAAIGVITWST